MFLVPRGPIVPRQYRRPSSSTAPERNANGFHWCCRHWSIALNGLFTHLATGWRLLNINITHFPRLLPQNTIRNQPMNKCDGVSSQNNTTSGFDSDSSHNRFLLELPDPKMSQSSVSIQFWLEHNIFESIYQVAGEAGSSELIVEFKMWSVTFAFGTKSFETGSKVTIWGLCRYTHRVVSLPLRFSLAHTQRNGQSARHFPFPTVRI